MLRGWSCSSTQGMSIWAHWSLTVCKCWSVRTLCQTVNSVIHRLLLYCVGLCEAVHAWYKDGWDQSLLHSNAVSERYVHTCNTSNWWTSPSPTERPPLLRARGSTVASGAEQVITYLQEQVCNAPLTDTVSLIPHHSLLWRTGMDKMKWQPTLHCSLIDYYQPWWVERETTASTYSTCIKGMAIAIKCKQVHKVTFMYS